MLNVRKLLGHARPLPPACMSWDHPRARGASSDRSWCPPSPSRKEGNIFDTLFLGGKCSSRTMLSLREIHARHADYRNPPDIYTRPTLLLLTCSARSCAKGPTNVRRTNLQWPALAGQRGGCRDSEDALTAGAFVVGTVCAGGTRRSKVVTVVVVVVSRQRSRLCPRRP